MWRKFLFVWVVFLIFVCSKKAHAVYYNLSGEQIRQAIEYGEKNKDADSISFFNEWVSVSSDGYKWAVLNTKFNTLAYEAKQASLSSRKLTKVQISQILSDMEDTLLFHVVLYGDSYDFAKDYHAALLYKNKTIQPINEQNDTHAKITNLKSRKSGIFRADCRYEFPNYYVEPDAEIILVIISPLDKEQRFTFKLGEMR